MRAIIAKGRRHFCLHLETVYESGLTAEPQSFAEDAEILVLKDVFSRKSSELRALCGSAVNL
jgi:hypothetical protein